tara:strand:- start:32 stop:388 length:357 start_codon:yes stop_codon:yes gene_type:complete
MEKIDIKSMLIGALICACLLLIMGQTNDKEKIEQMVKRAKQQTDILQDTEILDDQAGRYQAIAGNKFEYFYLLDTGTGAVYTQIENPEKNTYKKRLADIWSNSPYIHAIQNNEYPPSK